jgi:F-type H+-transporting ATPase subunit a
MSIDPSEIVYFQWNFVRITATLVYTWITMLVLISVCFLITRKLQDGPDIGGGQNILEAVIETIRSQIQEISKEDPGKYIAFIGTLFIFILVSNILAVIPGYLPPTGSLNTTIALALCVFLAVPVYGVASQGLGKYLKQYLKPSLFMLPFNIIGEISRTLSLAIRLYGNMMSSTIIIAILLGVIPLFFPVVMQLFGLLTGLIQAYIFAILAIVFIASASKQKEQNTEEN